MGSARFWRPDVKPPPEEPHCSSARGHSGTLGPTPTLSVSEGEALGIGFVVRELGAAGRVWEGPWELSQTALVQVPRGPAHHGVQLAEGRSTEAEARAGTVRAGHCLAARGAPREKSPQPVNQICGRTPAREPNLHLHLQTAGGLWPFLLQSSDRLWGACPSSAAEEGDLAPKPAT